MASSANPDFLDDLNPEQREAVCFGDGPLLVLAGAGTGKTRTIAYRVAHLIARGVEAPRILLLTFTRRAAEEMIRRARSAAASPVADWQKLWGGTFHSVGNRLLRLYGPAAGLPADFTVMDQTDAEDLLNILRQEHGLHASKKRFPRKQTCLAVYSRCVNGSEPLKTVLARSFPWCAGWETELKDLFRAYVERKQKLNVLDYDDLLLYWVRMLDVPEIAERVEARFDHILVDEYQDTNRLQARILKAMRRANRNITVVGDDAQSIYSFRAATVRNILDFPEDFPGARIVTISRNYRSVAPVLETANRLIGRSDAQYRKVLVSHRGEGRRPRFVTCRDEDQQDDYVIDRVLEHLEQGIDLRRQAVLFRTGYHSDSLEVKLARRDIPYHKYGGLRFLETAHIKDMLAFLRIPENPRDETAWFRALLLMDGIGPSTARRITDHAAAHRGCPASLAEIRPPKAAAPLWPGFCRLLEDLAASPPLPVAGQVERVRRFYDPLLERRYENPRIRARDLESLEQIASGYASRSQFLAELLLDPPSATSDLAGNPTKDDDWLVLSTIHSAKGCEWDVVYLIHASDGCLPADMATDTPEAIEEERRLAYVAMTRARDFLYVTWPLRYYKNRSRFTDTHVYAQPSRFLAPDVVAAMDTVTLPGPGGDDGDTPLPRADGIDIRGQMREMWT